MSLVNIRPAITLDIYDHNLTPSTIKAIALDSGTRFVAAMIRDRGEIYDIGQDAAVVLTVVRPDKTRVQITGETYSLTEVTRDDETITYYGASAELTQLALAIKGNLKAQFKITSGEQELRTEIFTINNGEALDAGDGDWAGDLDGHNLDEMAQSIEDLSSDVSEIQEDVSDLKEGLNNNRGLLYSELDIPVDISSGGAKTETLINGYYDTSGSFVENNTRGVTEFIEIASLEHLYYTGRYSGKVATFWDSNREYISQAFNPYDSDWTNRDIMESASSFPSNAVYITLQTKLLSAYNPPSVEPVIVSVTVSTGGFLYESIVGDGVADDSTAIQNLVNTRSVVRIPRGMKIRLDSAVSIPNTCQLFDGGNSEFIAYGVCAFVVTGELTGSMSANPNTLDQTIIDGAGRIIQNCKIKGGTGAEDGIQASGCFKNVFSNLYIHNVANGIKFTGRNRDTTVINCSIYACAECGVLLESNVNFHQCNLVNLFVSYCHKCIAIDSPQAIANVQINGCDIEISSYPDTGKDTARCIYITCGSSSSSDQLSEIEISGCTIQGHNLSDGLIEIVGISTRKIRNISICGNHISNTSGGNPAIILSDCDNISISGNTIAEVYQILAMANCTCISLVGNSAGANDQGARGLAEIGGANSGLLINGNVISGLSGKGITLLTGATVTDSCIVGNIIKATGGVIQVSESATDRVVVASNII